MSEYAGTPESFAWFRGRTVPGAAIRVWTSRDRSTLITQIQRPDDGYLWPDGLVRADAQGWFRFQTVHPYESVFVEAVGGDGILYRIDRADVGSRVRSLEQSIGTITSDAATARARADEAHTLARAARDVLDDELERVGEPEGLVRLNSSGKVGFAHLPADSAASAFLTWGDYWQVSPERPPQVAGHQGMPGIVPANTLEGVRAYLDVHPFQTGAQVPVVWIDLFTSSEQALVAVDWETASAHHGSWTNTLVHNIHLDDFNAGSVRKARIDGSLFHPRWGNLTLGSLEDFFAEFAGRCLFVLNLREAGLVRSRVVDTITNYGMQDSVVVAMAPGAWWEDLHNHNIATMLTSSGPLTDAQMDRARDSGVEWVGLRADGLTPVNGGDRVAAARARGFKVCLRQLTRHYELDRARQWGDAGWPFGCDLYTSPEPLYCSYTHRAKSVFHFGPTPDTYTHGQLSNAQHSGYRFPWVPEGPSTVPGQHVLNNPTGEGDNLDGPLWAIHEVPGWAVPVSGEGAQEIEFMAHILRASPGSWLTLGFGFSDDKPWAFQSTGEAWLTGDPSLNGWIAVARDDGNLYLRKVTDGELDRGDTATLTTGGGGISVPGRMGMRVHLTPTQVRVELLTETRQVHKTLIHEDTSPYHRGRYFAWGTRRNEAILYYQGAGGRN